MQNILQRFKNNNQPDISNPIRQRVLKYLTDNEWTIQQGEHSINVKVRCTNAVFPIFIFIYEDLRMIQMYSYLETCIPEKKRPAVSEFCTRVNDGISIGNFEFDMDEGEVMYKTSIALGDDIEFLTDDIIDNLIGFNYTNMNKYYPGFMKIVYSNQDVKSIIEEIENPKVE